MHFSKTEITIAFRVKKKTFQLYVSQNILSRYDPKRSAESNNKNIAQRMVAPPSPHIKKTNQIKLPINSCDPFICVCVNSSWHLLRTSFFKYYAALNGISCSNVQTTQFQKQILVFIEVK